MDSATKQPSSRVAPLAFAWLGLALLTLASIGLGNWLNGTAALPLLVAAIIWMKAGLVARYYLEVQLSHAFIRRMVMLFIAFVPLALVLTDLFGAHLAKWLTL